MASDEKAERAGGEAKSMLLEAEGDKSPTATQIADAKRQTRIREQDAARIAIQKIFQDTEGSALRAWFRNFDRNHDMRITFREFCVGMASMNYVGNATDLFTSIDLDGSGELSLEEICEESADVWMHLRSFCVEKFASVTDLLSQVSGGDPNTIKDLDTFREGFRRVGWSKGYEDVFFNTIDCMDMGCITKLHLKWFEADKERQKRKLTAKRRALKEAAKKGRETEQIQKVFKEFKAFLKQKYSCYLRAWRRGLDLDGSMSVQKSELFKACKDMAWSGDVRLLWKALDKDASGVTALEELDIESAEQLAKFKAFTTQSFGSATASFKVFDASNAGKLKEADFIKACKNHGFDRANKALFMGLDHDMKKYILEKDLAFLDQWKPQPYLICQPSKQAAHAFKECLLKVYKNFVKAWRVCLDRDNSNVVNWGEFETAAKRIRFKGDVAGAWRYLDNDLGGFITLAEIDKDASDVLLGFKQWCDEEFGGVRSAFSTFDSDGSGEVNFSEFRSCCIQYGYPHNAKLIFNAIDTDGQGLVAFNEISFLDDWELPPEPHPDPSQLPPVEQMQLVPSEKMVQMQKDARMEKIAHARRQEAYISRLALPTLRGANEDMQKKMQSTLDKLVLPQYEGPYRWTAKNSRERLAAQLARRPFIGL